MSQQYVCCDYSTKALSSRTFERQEGIRNYMIWIWVRSGIKDVTLRLAKTEGRRFYDRIRFVQSFEVTAHYLYRIELRR